MTGMTFPGYLSSSTVKNFDAKNLGIVVLPVGPYHQFVYLRLKFRVHNTNVPYISLENYGTKK